MSGRTQVYLQNFFVYNPTYGKREDEEHKKVIYYYPQDVEQDVKLRNVGFCEALVNFTQTFSPSKPCEVLHTQKTRQFFLQPEENFWMVMTIGLPTQQKTRNSQLYVEHLSDDIQDNVYQALMEGLYRTFQMFCGSLSEVLASNKAVLKDFLDWQIPHLRIQHADLLDVFQGVQFLPLDKHAFLRVQCFVNRLEGRFREIRSSVFLCNDQLVWSGLEQCDMQVLYQHLVHDVLQSTVESELLPGFSFSRPATSATTHCRFLYGAVDEEETLSRTPRIYVSDALGKREQCHLLIFRAYSATLCLLVNATHKLSVAFLKSLDSYLATEFTALANEIGKQCTKLSSLSSSPADSQSKYIYFNRMNLAQKSTVHSERRSGIVVPPELVRFLADINEDLQQLEDAGEMTAKTTSEWWVVGKLSDEREFYVVLNQKSANIIQIQDEVKRLCASQFQNIFFLD